MKVLFLTQVLPYPLDAGPKVRAYYTLRHLARQHTVTLAAFVRPSDTPEAIAHLRELCQRVETCAMPRSRLRDLAAYLRSLRSGEPFLIARDHAPAMFQTLERLARAEDFDLIHADQLWMAPYALAARAAGRAAGRQPRLVLDQHNAVYLIPQRMAQSQRSPWLRAVLGREARTLARYEAGVCRRFDEVVTVTQADQAALLRENPDGLPGLKAVIPICIEPGPRPPAAFAARPGNVLFLGGMHWPPNAEGAVWFAQDIWPRVRARVPQGVFWAVGKNPPAGLRDRPPEAGIRAAGYVEDVEEYWNNSHVFVVPLRSGGGMRVKILDAWAHGVPVVSTTVGAEGLQWVDGENILVADTAEALAEAVARVLTETALADRLARGGRMTVEQHYDWRTVYGAWDEVYAAALGAENDRAGIGHDQP